MQPTSSLSEEQKDSAKFIHVSQGFESHSTRAIKYPHIAPKISQSTAAQGTEILEENDDFLRFVQKYLM